MKAIAVVDKNWGIGKDGALLVHLPGDLKYFKENTLGKVLIMGRKTLESLPGGKALPGRTTIVLSGDENYEPKAAEGARTLPCTSFDELMATLLSLEFAEGIDLEDDVIAAGGESIYKQFLPYCNEILITKIDAEFDADKHFENLDELADCGMMKITYESEVMEENGVRYRFLKYSRQTR
ncbi:MAG: dihydrofolate reductase [Firmicutes bacterium]|nr:dihydrofolate reductase [Bacillota bacterium]